jgi:hypothetical protein
MIDKKTITERDHPRCPGAKQYKFVEEFAGSPTVYKGGGERGGGG